MTIQVRPLGVVCNLSCKYCYQSPQRQAGNIGNSCDVELMKLAVQEEGGSFTLFGGEPLKPLGGWIRSSNRHQRLTSAGVCP